MQNRINYIPLSRAYSLIEDCDVVLFRRPVSFLSVGWWIGLYTGSVYSHVALAFKEDGINRVIEFREFKGCRTKDLSEYISEKAVIDIYRLPKSVNLPYTLVPPGTDDDLQPKTDYVILTFNDRVKKTILAEAKSFVGQPYGYINIFRIFLALFPFIRFFYTKNDINRRPKHWVCSTLIAYSIRRHWLDLNPNINDCMVSPSDISNASAGALNYQFSISEI